MTRATSGHADVVAELNGPASVVSPSARPKILYLAGWGRSGTTILANILGQLDGFVSAGELHYIWSRGFEGDWLCGCGVPLASCPQWSSVFDRGFGGRTKVDLQEVLLAKRAVRLRSLLTLWRASRRLRPGAYGVALGRLYGGIFGASSASVVVDASKSPADAVVAAGLSEYEVFVVHVVRDPRAVAFSWGWRSLASGRSAEDGFLDRIGWVRSTAMWLVFNIVIETIVRSAVRGRVARMRYEDFVKRPVEAVELILAFLGVRDAARAGVFVTPHAVKLSAVHTASGNPNRFATGIIEIRPDDEWSREMPRLRRLAVSVFAAPLLKRYGYPLRVPRGRPQTRNEKACH